MIRMILVLTLWGVALPAAAERRLMFEQWAPPGATVFYSTDAAAYVYKYYVQGSTVGVVITGITCTTSNNPLVKTCSAPLPAALIVGTTFDVTANLFDEESTHSNTTRVLSAVVPSMPTRLRIFGVILSPLSFLGSKVRRIM